jgi:spermidine/putrescine transport system ATP-binding protein
MQAELTKLQRELGITFLYVTHSQSEAFAMADRVVILNQGRVQQNGTPREVFRAPANRFVAEFVGTNNIFPGTLRCIDGERGMVDTPAGILPARLPSEPLSNGSMVDLVISADLVQLTSEPVDGFPAIPVDLISEQFIGTMVTVFLDMGSERILRVQTRQRVLEELLARGQSQLFASWRPADALLLATNR